MNKASYDSVKLTAKTSRRLMSILWHDDRRTVIETIFAYTTPGILPFVNAYIYARIINFVITVVDGHHHSYTKLYVLIGIRISMLLLQDITFTVQRRTDMTINSKLPLIFSQRIMNQLARLDVSMLEDSDFQNKFQTAKDEATWRPRVLFNDLMFSMQSALQLVVATISLLFLNWIFALVILMTAIPAFIYQARSAKEIWSIWDTNSPYRKRYSYLYDTLQSVNSVKELKLFRLSSHFAKLAKQLGDKFMKENNATLHNQFLLGVASNTVNVFGYAVVEIYIILGALAKRLSVGSLTYYTNVLINFQNGINGLFRSTADLFNDTQYVQIMFDILDIQPEIVSPDGGVHVDSSATPLIEFRHVYYAYPGSTTNVLDDFCLTIQPGETVAFVGENGAGKTTIIKLLCRFYDVTAGEILINGVDLRQLDLVSWYESLGVLFQDFLKYNYTLKENIWFGQVNKPIIMEDIVIAAEQSGADAVMRKLPRGYDQLLGSAFEDSQDLSVGQWQKVALARGFYRNAPILILDEPTAAIDAKAEHEIFKRVEQLADNKTAIIISHRFSTVRNASTIYVVEHGRVAESGTHAKLMKQQGIYADLFNLQAEAYR